MRHPRAITRRNVNSKQCSQQINGKITFSVTLWICIKFCTLEYKLPFSQCSALPVRETTRQRKGPYLLVAGFQQEPIQGKLLGDTRHTSLGWLHTRCPTKAQMKFWDPLEEIEVSSTDTYCISNLTVRDRSTHPTYNTTPHARWMPQIKMTMNNNCWV